MFLIKNHDFGAFISPTCGYFVIYQFEHKANSKMQPGMKLLVCLFAKNRKKLKNIFGIIFIIKQWKLYIIYYICSVIFIRHITICLGQILQLSQMELCCVCLIIASFVFFHLFNEALFGFDTIYSIVTEDINQEICLTLVGQN